MRGDGGNSQNCRKGRHAQNKSDTNDEKLFVEKENEHQEPVGAAKPAKKTRKPDREFYQPGSRRNIQGKDSGAGREQDKPPKKEEQKTEPESQQSTRESGVDIKTSIQKQSGKDKRVKGTQESAKVFTSSEASRKQGSQDVETPEIPVDASVEKITSKVENLNMQEKDKVEYTSQDAGELSCKGREPTDKKRRGQGSGTKDEEEKSEKKRERGNRRRRGVEKTQDSRKEDEAGDQGKNNQRNTEREKDKRAVEADVEKMDKAKQTHQNKGRENRRENRSGETNNSRSRDAERDAKTEKNVNRNRSNANVTTPTSKRYSKSDIRRSRNRTYSSSSASSVTSLDYPGLGKDVESTNWSHSRDNNKKGAIVGGEGQRHPLKSWTTNEESSTESLEGSEMSDRADDRRRKRRGGEGQLSRERQRGERNRQKGNKGGGQGILRVSLEKQSDTSSHSGDAQHRKEGPIPRGRGGGILVLPARTDISNSPEVGQRLLFGGIRGGAAGRSRGGRGGGARRLWDPNNPDQKPALTSTGYGQLHFLDTDDEVAGSPPVTQGERFRSQQASAMAYYKFQNSDNPYCYPVPSSSPHNPNTNQRYPFPYHMGHYQMAYTNSMYPSPGVGQFCSNYRGSGYSLPGAGGSVTFEEAEQHTRGELGRLLRAADAQELQLSNLLSRDRVSADGLDRMAQLRADLLGIYEQVILTDIEFSDSQNVDQALWKNVFYQVIERFRQLLKEPTYDNAPHIRNKLLTLLDEGELFFDALLQKLQTVYQFKLEDYMDGMAIRARPLRKTVKYALISAQRCMICQGDIARYREQASDSANYGKARSWYLKAQQIAPKNGRPYNQLALLAVYTKRKLDAVCYYMRSLAASNPILTAKESLMSLFEEAKLNKTVARTLVILSPFLIWPCVFFLFCFFLSLQLNKRFILSFLHAHGKLFTKVGMETFPGAATRVLQEFRTLLQHGPHMLGSTHMLQIITINMFAVINDCLKFCLSGEEGEVRSVLQEQSTALGLGMFALLVQRCTELLQEIPGKAEEMEGLVRVSAFPLELREMLPSIKVWSDWMLGHPDQWNPPPCSIDPNVWQCLADLCNLLARVDHGEVPLYKVDSEEGEGDEELMLLQLKEDRLLAGFVPLLAAPQEPCYTDGHTDMAIAADCKRVTVLKYFLEALCGQEEPLLAFKGGKYISVATPPAPNHSTDTRSRQDSLTEKEVTFFSYEEEVEEAGDSENDIRELKARRHVLANKLAQQQKRRDKIKEVLQTGGQLELEVRPLFLVPDTNGFIDHLTGLKKLLQCGTYIIVVPLIVITELDGLAKGQDSFGGGVEAVQEKARMAVAFLEKGFEAREQCLRALTSRGNQLESIAFRSEDMSGQQGNNDDIILSCCLHYCKDKAKDFMPHQRNGTVRLQREVVLLTDDRNLRVKALTRNVPVRDIPSFLSWAKVG
uniref:Telomerase-binding protein EST1A n=1 Tax=Astatotilapia calliptera TaxID=8154 RepID=A0A3P8NSN7_ASTCA